jgi:hypothetical protein
LLEGKKKPEQNKFKKDYKNNKSKGESIKPYQKTTEFTSSKGPLAIDSLAP